LSGTVPFEYAEHLDLIREDAVVMGGQEHLAERHSNDWLDELLLWKSQRSWVTLAE
jgi:hypothetical protein